MWKVYDKTGMKIRCEVRKVQYSGTFMGECFVNTTLYSEIPIEFEIGDYFIYRNEQFTINYDPSVLKKAGVKKSGEAYVYDGVKFNSYSDELTRCDFLDYILADNYIHFSSLPNFSFFASSIQDLADRIQANLDRVYTGDQKWIVEVHPEYVDTTNVNIDVSKIKVWAALDFIKSKFNANFIIRERRIIIGTAGVAIDNVFQYGKGKGLVEIQRIAESNQQIITRLRVYGSTRNLPVRYYNKLSNASLTNYLPNNMAVQNLMLPDFPRNTLDAYIDSPNVSVLGVREDSVYFDGSDESLPEIYPSMEGMTAEQLISGGISCSIDAGDNGNLDEIASDATDKDGKPISDDGTWDELKEGDNIPPFVLTLKDIGFDLNDYLTGETATISMKDGMCGGREFEVTKCEKKGNKYVLTCNRVYDDGLKLYFPYKYYNIKAGDKFVLLNIDMPEVYITAASQRLLKVGKEYLEKNDYVRYTYEVKIDEIYMALHPQLYNVLKEGDLMLFTEADFNIDGSIIIDSLRINEGEGLVPTYEVTLADEKQVGTIEKIQNSIDSVVNGQGSGGYNAQQINSLIKTYGRKYFLSKIEKDKASEVIDFEKGIELGKFTPGSLGAGGIIQVDSNGKTYIEVDEIYVRLKAIFDSLTIKELQSVGGEILLTLASIECTKVEFIGSEQLYDLEGARLLDSEGNYLLGNENTPPIYRCFFTVDDGSKAIINQFAPGDFAQCRQFNIKEGVYEGVSNRYYWRYVVSVGENFIDLSVDDCDEGSDIPQAGDKIIQLGNCADPARQNAILLSAYGNTAPTTQMFQGIDSYSLEGKAVKEEGFDSVNQQFYSNTYGRNYIGARDGSSYMKYTPENGMEVDGASVKVHTGGKVWEVNRQCQNIVGNPEGRRLVLDGISADLKVYDDNNKVVNIFEGDSYKSVDDLYVGNLPSVTVVDKKPLLTVLGKDSVIVSDEKIVNIFKEDYFYADSLMDMDFNFSFVSQNYTGTTGAASCVTGYELHLLAYTDIYSSPVSDRVIRHDKRTESGTATIYYTEQRVTINPGLFYRIIFRLYASLTPNGVSSMSEVGIIDISISFSKSGYMSRFFANGLALGTSTNNIFAVFNKHSAYRGNYIEAEIHNEEVGLKISTQKLLAKQNPFGFQNEIPWGMVPRMVACGRARCTSTSAYFPRIATFDDSTLNIERRSEGRYLITLPTEWGKYDLPNTGYVMVTGYGYVAGGSSPIKANVSDFIGNSFFVVLSDDATPNDADGGGFYFEIKVY